jgi:hypothetical protein
MQEDVAKDIPPKVRELLVLRQPFFGYRIDAEGER